MRQVSAISFQQSAISRQRATGSLQRGFTLTELMVAVVVLILLLGMVATVYNASSKASRHNNAVTEVKAKGRALRQQLQEDLREIYKQGYLVLIREDFSNLSEEKPGGARPWTGLSGRGDQLLFWRTGRMRSFCDGTVEANLGLVCYAHLRMDATSDPAVAQFGITPGDNTVMNHWAWGRRARLYAPDIGSPPNDVLQIDPNAAWGASVEPISFAEHARLISDPANFRDRMAELIDPRPTVASVTDIVSQLMLERCGSVSIRFLLPTEDADHDGEIITGGNEDDGYMNWPPDSPGGGVYPETNIWLDLPPEGTECIPPGYASLGPYAGIGVVCFTPDSDIWPRALEFTVRIYDRTLSVTGFDEDLGTEHAGQTLRFVVELPR